MSWHGAQGWGDKKRISAALPVRFSPEIRYGKTTYRDARGRIQGTKLWN